MQIPATNHVSMVHNVAAIVWLQFMVHVMRFLLLLLLLLLLIIIIIIITVMIFIIVIRGYNILISL